MKEDLGNKSQQIEAYNLMENSELTESVEALSRVLQEKEARAAQLQKPMSTPEQLVEFLTLVTQIAELNCRMQDAEQQRQQEKSENEAAVLEVEAIQRFLKVLHMYATCYVSEVSYLHCN